MHAYWLYFDFYYWLVGLGNLGALVLVVSLVWFVPYLKEILDAFRFFCVILLSSGICFWCLIWFIEDGYMIGFLCLLRYCEGWIWLTILEKWVGEVRRHSRQWFSMRGSFLRCPEDLLQLIPGMTWRLVNFCAAFTLLCMTVYVLLVLNE